MKPRTQPRRMSEKKRKALGNKPVFSTIAPSGKGVKRVNTKAKAKRKIGYRKMLASPEYKVARAEAMRRAGNQCELWLSWAQYPQSIPLPLERTGASNAITTHVMRCAVAYDLQAHHKRYPKGRKLEARDLVICCKPHHEYLESLKPHKQRMF